MYDLRDGYVPPHLRGDGGQAAGGDQPPVAPLSPVQGAGEAGPPGWAAQRVGTGRRTQYPYRTIPVNGTFQIPPGEKQPTLNSLRVYCIKRSKDLGRKFRCHRYPDGTLEVWREK